MFSKEYNYSSHWPERNRHLRQQQTLPLLLLLLLSLEKMGKKMYMLLYCKTCCSTIEPAFYVVINNPLCFGGGLVFVKGFTYEPTVIILVYPYVINTHILSQLSTCKP